MEASIPWQAHAIRGAVILLLVVVFQQLVRGSITPVVAVTVAIGYVIVAEFVRRHT